MKGKKQEKKHKGRRNKVPWDINGGINTKKSQIDGKKYKKVNIKAKNSKAPSFTTEQSKEAERLKSLYSYTWTKKNRK